MSKDGNTAHGFRYPHLCIIYSAHIFETFCKMPKLTAYIANCLMGGAEITHRPDGSWIRDVVRFKCDRWEFCFRQHADIAHGKTESLRGTLSKTTTVEIDDVRHSDKEQVLTTLDAICWLLSFATQSQVLCYGYEFPEGTTTAQFKSAAGIANAFRPPFDLRDPNSIRAFVEQAYPAYRKLNKTRKLPVVFDYLDQVEHPNQPIEIQLLLLFITLENLKDTYARTAGIPYIKGYYRKPPKTSGKTGEKFGFEELLHEMLLSVGMRRGLKQVVTLRNEIIHSGLSRKSHARQWTMCERIQDLVREYIFRLLDYQGEFCTYASRGYATKKV